MTEYTKEEALVFIQTIRMTLSDKVGFQWLTAKLHDLEAYIDSVATQNEQFNAYLDATHSIGDYESYLSTHTVADGNECGNEAGEPCST